MLMLLMKNIDGRYINKYLQTVSEQIHPLIS